MEPLGTQNHKMTIYGSSGASGKIIIIIITLYTKGKYAFGHAE